MTINITAGECLKEILETKYNDSFIPFNEAMSIGSYSAKLFSDDFIKERANTHKVSEMEYRNKLKLFLDFIHNIANYDSVVLWFGDDDFCKANISIVLKSLDEYNYKGQIKINIVDELKGDILYENKV